VILELDIGNSRIKWRYVEENGGAVAERGSNANLDELFAELSVQSQPEWARASSVRNANINAAVVEWIKSQWGIDLRLARVTRRCAGVSNQYEEPLRMGVDRWLAMLAAFNEAKGPCIVVDSGTALTVDVIDEDGAHKGGYIVPGLQLMGRSLEENTLIRLQGRGNGTTALAHSTDDAVRSGCLAALVALIERTAGSYDDRSVALFLSGGDARMLSENLLLNAQVQCCIVEDLVMNGLAIAVPGPAIGS